MPANPKQSVVILDEAEEITLADLTRACRVQADWVMELVEEGVIEPRAKGRAAMALRRDHRRARAEGAAGCTATSASTCRASRSRCSYSTASTRWRRACVQLSRGPSRTTPINGLPRRIG